MKGGENILYKKIILRFAFLEDGSARENRHDQKSSR